MEEDKNIDRLHIGLVDNGSGHSMFKLRNKEAVSINRVTEILMSQILLI